MLSIDKAMPEYIRRLHEKLSSLETAKGTCLKLWIKYICGAHRIKLPSVIQLYRANAC